MLAVSPEITSEVFYGPKTPSTNEVYEQSVDNLLMSTLNYGSTQDHREAIRYTGSIEKHGLEISDRIIAIQGFQKAFNAGTRT